MSRISFFATQKRRNPVLSWLAGKVGAQGLAGRRNLGQHQSQQGSSGRSRSSSALRALPELWPPLSPPPAPAPPPAPPIFGTGTKTPVCKVLSALQPGAADTTGSLSLSACVPPRLAHPGVTGNLLHGAQVLGGGAAHGPAEERIEGAGPAGRVRDSGERCAKGVRAA